MAFARARPDAAGPDIEDIGARLARLERELAILAERVAELDRVAALGSLSGPAALPVATAAMTGHADDRSTRIITLTGQMLIALGVGYLLRALTEAGLVTRWAGVWIGLVYAVGWTGLALVAARRGDRLAAWFAAALAPMLAFPLIIEAALRFDLWTAHVAFLVLTVVTAVSLASAILTTHQSLAWLTCLGAGGTAAALMVGLRAYVSAEIFYIALGIATLWLGYLSTWGLLRWPSALAADVVAVALVLRALTPDAHESPYAVMGVLLLLLLAYPASIMARTILLNRPVVLFEVVQSLALLLLLRGALALEPAIGAARPVLGFSVLTLGAAAFATGVWFGGRRAASAINAHFYAALGVVTLMVGSAILLDTEALAACWAVMALVAIALARWRAHAALVVYGAAFGVAAAVPSGLVTYATRALVSTEISGLAAPPTAALATCMLIAALVWIVARPTDEASEPLRRTVAVTASIVFLWAAAGLLAGVAIGLTGGASTVRTAALSAAACAAAAVGRWRPLAALAWMAYPFLAFVAVKLLAEDLRVDRPMALFIALAVYGAALITTARLGRRSAVS